MVPLEWNVEMPWTERRTLCRTMRRRPLWHLQKHQAAGGEKDLSWPETQGASLRRGNGQTDGGLISWETAASSVSPVAWILELLEATRSICCPPATPWHNPCPPPPNVNRWQLREPCPSAVKERVGGHRPGGRADRPGGGEPLAPPKQVPRRMPLWGTHVGEGRWMPWAALRKQAVLVQASL